MVNFLIKHLIKDYKNIKDPKVRSSYGLLCSSLSIILNLILFLIKLSIGLIVKSISITADAFNNLSDSASSIINILAFKFSLKPPDKEHPLGHGRYEYISSFIISILIIFIGILFVKSSLSKIFSKDELNFSFPLIFILIISIFIKIFIGLINRSIGKKIESSSLKATSIDAFYDALITFILSISLILSNFINISLDGYAGVIISIFIIFSGIKLIKETISSLLGEAPSDKIVTSLKEKILSYKNILGLHDLIMHNYGPNKIIASIHAEVPSYMTLFDVHSLIDRIEKDVEDSMGIHLVIHIDPVDVNNKESLLMYEDIKAMLIDNIKEISDVIDFRILNKHGVKTIYFEIKIKSEYYDKIDYDIIKLSTTLVKNKYKDFECKIFKNNIFN